MATNRGYFDADIDVVKILESAALPEVFYLKDLQQRKLFLDAEISQLTVSDSVKNILQYNREDIDIPVAERKPILLYVASVGGEVDAGFELIDVILSSKTPVYTVNLGYQYSMGFLIGLSGHKRYALKNSKYLMHDGSSIEWGTSAKVQDRMEFQKRVETRIKNYILERSKLTAEEYDNKYRVEWYMFADEAKEKGFTDFIVGEDCEIDEIV